MSEGGINSKTYMSINPNNCRPWNFHNRSLVWLESCEQEELINSIKRDGQHSAGLVRETTKDGYYEIIFGFRRLEACKKLGIDFLTGVLPKQTPDKLCMQLMHTENKASHDVSPLENAKIYRKALIENVYFNQDELSEKLALTQGYVSRLLKAATLFDHEWIIPFIEPVINQISIRAACMGAAKLRDKKQALLLQKSLHAQKQKGIIDAYQLTKILSASINPKKSSKNNETVLVKKGRLKMVTLQTDEKGGVSINIKKYLKSESEVKKLINMIAAELEQKLIEPKEISVN